MKFDANGWLDEAIEIDYLNKSMDRQGYAIKYIVIHATAGGTDAEAIAHFFRDEDRQASAHLIIDQQGKIAQGIPLSIAAWGNGIIDANHASFIPQFINPNLYTVSIEHVKEHDDNSDELTPIQANKSFEVINLICDTYSIPKHAGDANGGIIKHSDITNTACPGPYPWDDLWAYLKGRQQPMQPTANQLKAANDCWGSVFWSNKQQPPQTGTGIYQAWLTAYAQGTFYGPAITDEYSSVDWNGNPITVQEFARARCEWSNGVPNWYSINGKI